MELSSCVCLANVVEGVSHAARSRPQTHPSGYPHRLIGFRRLLSQAAISGTACPRSLLRVLPHQILAELNEFCVNGPRIPKTGCHAQQSTCPMSASGWVRCFGFCQVTVATRTVPRPRQGRVSCQQDSQTDSWVILLEVSWCCTQCFAGSPLVNLTS